MGKTSMTVSPETHIFFLCPTNSQEPKYNQFTITVDDKIT